MKRSRINQAIRRMEEVIQANGFHLPPYRLLCNEYLAAP